MTYTGGNYEPSEPAYDVDQDQGNVEPSGYDEQEQDDPTVDAAERLEVAAERLNHAAARLDDAAERLDDAADRLEKAEERLEMIGDSGDCVAGEGEGEGGGANTQYDEN